MKILMKSLLVALIFILIAPSLTAQTQKISIQGILKDGNGGAVADGDYSLTFTLYDTLSGGTMVWTETQPAVSVSSGVYSALLGTSNDFSGVAFDISYFLGVKINGGTELTPRTELTYAPYAIAVDKIESSTLAGNVFKSTGQVGIGTNAPTGKLTVQDTSLNAITIRTTDNDKNNGIAFQNSGTGYTWNIRRDGSMNPDLVIAGGPVIPASTALSSLPERMRIKSDGTVAIAQKLEIENTIKIAGGSPGAGKVLTATDNSGNATWKSNGVSVVWMNQGTVSDTNVSGTPGTQLNLSQGTTANLSVISGDVISVNGFIRHRFVNASASGNDRTDYFLVITPSGGCNQANVNALIGIPNGSIDPAPTTSHSINFKTHVLVGAFASNCTGDLKFHIGGEIISGDGDAQTFRTGALVVRKN